MKEIKIEWCENFIISLFKKHYPYAKGIEVNLFWQLAEESGLWIRGTYGSPLSKALEKLVIVKTVSGEDGEYLFDSFVLA